MEPRKAVAREAALGREQVASLPHPSSLASLQEVLRESLPAEALPSWVVFPDKARAEWVNSLLSQVSLVPGSLHPALPGVAPGGQVQQPGTL